MAAHSYVLSYVGAHEAPSASGLFTIFSADRWVYVGESDDIRQSLFQLLNESPEWMDRFGPLSFSFERLPAAGRAAYRQAVAMELKPAHPSGAA